MSKLDPNFGIDVVNAKEKSGISRAQLIRISSAELSSAAFCSGKISKLQNIDFGLYCPWAISKLSREVAHGTRL